MHNFYISFYTWAAPCQHAFSRHCSPTSENILCIPFSSIFNSLFSLLVLATLMLTDLSSRWSSHPIMQFLPVKRLANSMSAIWISPDISGFIWQTIHIFWVSFFVVKLTISIHCHLAYEATLSLKVKMVHNTKWYLQLLTNVMELQLEHQLNLIYLD